MSCATDSNSEKFMSRAKEWTADVENLFRFQAAGYRDELEYRQVKQVDLVDRWPDTGFVKKLQRRDGTFYFYSRKRECQDSDIRNVKIYAVLESGLPWLNRSYLFVLSPLTLTLPRCSVLHLSFHGSPSVDRKISRISHG
ncbi:hypothetical protein LDENG_00046260 [Lucifuga dentata]|nr:hypothetical protein LDENG_00046260 [Lucifuga dentata]